MIPLSSLQIRMPDDLSEGAFIRCLEYHPRPIIVGSTFGKLAGVYFGSEVTVDALPDGCGAGVVIPDYKIMVDPASLRSLNMVEQRGGLIVIHNKKIAIFAKHDRGFGHAIVEVGKSDITDLPNSYCFTQWKAVVETGDETITLLERKADGSIALPI